MFAKPRHHVSVDVGREVAGIPLGQVVSTPVWLDGSDNGRGKTAETPSRAGASRTPVLFSIGADECAHCRMGHIFKVPLFCVVW